MANDWMTSITCIIILICHVRSILLSPQTPLDTAIRLDLETSLEKNDSRSISSSEIPLDIWFGMTNIKSAKEFIQRFVHVHPNRSPIKSVDSRVFSLDPGGIDIDPDPDGLELPLFFRPHRPDPRVLEGSDSRVSTPIERMSEAVAIPAICEPRLSTVEIPTPQDPTVVMWPTCTLIERCGGCCTHPLLQCVPTAVEMVNVKVMKVRYSQLGANFFTFEGNVDVQLEKHTNCICACRIKPSDCSELQDYKDCQCHCRNKSEAAKCLGNKIWSGMECRCVCATILPCPTGYFSQKSCSCQVPRRPTIRPRRPSKNPRYTTLTPPYNITEPILTET